MSASIYYQPVKPKSTKLKSAQFRVLRKEFGGNSDCVILNYGDLDTLKGMALVDEAYMELYDALVKHEEIRVWAVY